MRDFWNKSRWFFGYTAVFAVLIAYVFWGTWSPSVTFIQPDCGITYPSDDLARCLRNALCGGNFVWPDALRFFASMYVWQEFQYALAAYMAGLALAYYLKGRGVGPLARYGAALTYGFMGYNLTLFSAGHLGWFIYWMQGPFAFGLIDRAVRKGKWRTWILLGAVLAWSAARQPDLWLLFTLTATAYGLFKSIRRVLRAEARGAVAGRLALGVLVAVVTFLAIGAPQIRNAFVNDLAGRDQQIADTAGTKKGADAKRDAAHRWDFCTSWSLPPEDILEFAIPEIHGGSNDPRVSPEHPYRGRLGQCGTVPPGAQGRHPVTGQMLKAGDEYAIPYRQHSLHLGFVTLLLAVLGAALLPRKNAAGTDDADVSEARAETWFWVGAAGVSLLCALGRFTPFYRLVYLLPFGDYLRAPVKFVHVFEWCVAVLAGFGIQALLVRFGPRRAVAWGLAFALGANALALAYTDAKYCAVDPGETIRIAMCRQADGGAQLVADAKTPLDANAGRVLVSGAALGGQSALRAGLQDGTYRLLGYWHFDAARKFVACDRASATFALFENTKAPKPAAPEPKPVVPMCVVALAGTALVSLLAVGKIRVTVGVK